MAGRMGSSPRLLTMVGRRDRVLRAGSGAAVEGGRSCTRAAGNSGRVQAVGATCRSAQTQRRRGRARSGTARTSRTGRAGDGWRSASSTVGCAPKTPAALEGACSTRRRSRCGVTGGGPTMDQLRVEALMAPFWAALATGLAIAQPRRPICNWRTSAVRSRPSSSPWREWAAVSAARELAGDGGPPATAGAVADRLGRRRPARCERARSRRRAARGADRRSEWTSRGCAPSANSPATADGAVAGRSPRSQSRRRGLW